MNANTNPKKQFNCRDTCKCPLNGECLSGSIVYKATVKSGNDSRFATLVVQGGVS